MIWLLFAFLAALCTSLYDISAKRIIKQFSPLFTVWLWALFSTLFLIPLLFFITIPKLGPLFWPILFIDCVLNILAAMFYMKALKMGDLSLTVPILSFSPAFMFIASPLIVHEFPSFVGAFGILLIVAGSYLLNIHERANGVLQPFRALFRTKGTRYMFIVAVLWSIVANVEKLGAQQSSPLFWAISIDTAIAIVLIPAVLLFATNSMRVFPKNLHHFLPLGLFSALSLAFFMVAITLTIVPYVIAIKRLSILLTVFWGHYFLKEKGLPKRMVAAALMVAGVALIALT